MQYGYDFLIGNHFKSGWRTEIPMSRQGSPIKIHPHMTACLTTPLKEHMRYLGVDPATDENILWIFTAFKALNVCCRCGRTLMRFAQNYL